MLVQNRATGEELVQEAFARIWASPNTPSAEPDFRRWLYRAITNLARDSHRRRLIEAKLLFWNPPAVDPIDEVVHRAEDRELMRAMLALPLKDRQAIYLHYFDAAPRDLRGRLREQGGYGKRVVRHFHFPDIAGVISGQGVAD